MRKATAIAALALASLAAFANRGNGGAVRGAAARAGMMGKDAYMAINIYERVKNRTINQPTIHFTIPNVSVSKIVIDWSVDTSYDHSLAIVNPNGWEYFSCNGSALAYGSGSTRASVAYTMGTRMITEVDYLNNSMSVNGTRVSDAWLGMSRVSESGVIRIASSAISYWSCETTVYSVKIYANGQLVNDLRPARRSDTGVYGYYDVNKLPDISNFYELQYNANNATYYNKIWDEYVPIPR